MIRSGQNSDSCSTLAFGDKDREDCNRTGRNSLPNEHIENRTKKEERSAGTEVPALRQVRLATELENDFNCELHVELLAGTDPRRAVEVANGVTYEAKPCARVAGRTDNFGSASAAYGART